MFWKFNAPSSIQIDALLQKEDVTLQELMEEEELLQECKVQNKKLIDFLTQPEVLEDLVGLVVNDPPPDKELKVRFKHANLASELLTCDVPLIVDKVASSSNLLLMLYKFLEKEKPLNPLLASFVSKVFGMLVQRRSEQNWYSYQFTCFQVLDFLKSKSEFVEVAVKHIGTSAIMDLLSKLICGVDNDDQEIKRGIHEWLNDCGLIQQLIDKLSPDCDSEDHSSVDQLIQEIITTTHDPASNGSDSQSNGSQSRLLCTLESKEIVNKLMDSLLHEDRNESSVSHVINILLKLLSSKGSSKQSSLHQVNSVSSITEDSGDNMNTVLRTILDRLPELQKILTQPTKLGALYTSYGVEVERLGSTRLQVVNLMSALIETNDITVHSKFASLGTVQLFLDMFFKFSLNNFLHTQVASCITTILSIPMTTLTSEEENDVENSPNPDEELSGEIDGINNNPKNVDDKLIPEQEEFEPIKEFSQDDIIEKKPNSRLQSQETDPLNHPLLNKLLTDCGLVQKILEIYTKNETSMDENVPVSHNLVGYMGHIREIANSIVSQSKDGLNSLIITKLLEDLPNDIKIEWKDFVEVSLPVENLKNKVIPIQSYKDGDMDSMADLRFNDNDFKDTEEHLSGALQRLSSDIGTVETFDAGIDEESAPGSIEMFEDACSQRFSFDISTFDDMWKFKEKNITFGSFSKEAEEEEHNSHSSSEEEGDLDDEFDALRTNDEKMEVDFVPEDSNDWSEIFDKRISTGAVAESGAGENFNPWQSAPASDTAGNNSWADFGNSKSFDPFTQSDKGMKPASPSSDKEATSSSTFQPDFSNILVTSSPEFKPEPTTQEVQNICDANQHVENGCDNSTSSMEREMFNIDSEMESSHQGNVIEERSSPSDTVMPSAVNDDQIQTAEIDKLKPYPRPDDEEIKAMEIENVPIVKVLKTQDQSDSNTLETNA